MSNQATLGMPQAIKIDDRDAELHPMSLYELGLCENSYVAYCTREALSSVIGLGEAERKFALNAAAEKVADLDIDIAPIIEWVTGNYEGLFKMLSFCIDFPDGTHPSPRKAAQWYEANGKQDEGSATMRWMIDSRLRPDPTVNQLPEMTPEGLTTESDAAPDKEASTEPSSDGSGSSSSKESPEQ